MNRKEVLTTGEVARICHVAPRTVSKWFDTGKLRGYRIPGSRDRRIPVGQLAAFMRVHGIPLDGLDGGACRVLIVDSLNSPQQRDLFETLRDIAHYEVRTAENGFEAGLMAQRFRPHVIVLDTSDGQEEATTICRNIKSHPELQSVKVIATVAELDRSTRQRLIADGFDDCLGEPYSLEQFVQALEDATNLVG